MSPKGLSEEELKRLRAAIAGDGAYHEIAFSYDAENDKYVEPAVTKVEEPEDELYQVPQGLQVPKGMERPYNMKIHAIIEKTALFVSEQGGQMEIIIKMKQHANPQFAFMHLDNPLYPYYKHLVKEIKCGAYKPVQVKKVSRSEDEDDDDHYLHPSLMAGKAEDVPKFTVPTINFRRSYDDSYSVLVRNLQQHVTEETPQESPEQTNESNTCAPENNHLVSYYNDGTNADDDESHNEEHTEAVQTIVPPPPDIQPIIHKMAEYVAKNGGDFEFIVKSKNDKRFAFLQPGNEYYNYYVQKRDEAKLQLSGNTVSNEKNDSSNTPPSSDNKTVTCSVESAPVSTVALSEIKNENESITTVAKEEPDVTHSQDSQDAEFTSEPAEQETTPEVVKYDEQTDSMDFLDSPGTPKIIKEETKVKSKVLKGPISFSLKTKDSDTSSSDKPKTMTFLMDDSEEDSSDETKKEKESNKRRKSVDETTPQHNSRQNSVEREVKIPKLSNEILEAKLAEERIKDKLLAAARERLAQQKKEKQLLMEQQKREEQLKKEKQMLLDQQRKERQLQLERKRKAALFLKMLEKRNPNSNADSFQKTGNDKKDLYDKKSGKSSKSDSDFWVLPDTSSENGLLFPAARINISGTNLPISIPGIKTAWSSNSNTEESGEEEFITTYGSDSEPSKSVPPPPPSPPPVVVKHEHKKKKKKHSRSKSRERSRTDRSKSSKSREKPRSRSPRSRKLEKLKKEKEKELPAAYAFANRSRSRSPRRYRPSPSHWNRRR